MRAQLLYQQASICDWSSATDKSVIADLGIAGGVVPPFSMPSMEDDPASSPPGRSVLRSRNFRVSGLSAGATARRPEKLRLGYFSADFEDHAQYAFDRAYVSSCTIAIAWPCRRFLYMGRTLMSPFASGSRRLLMGFYDVRDLNDQAIAALARREEIDIAMTLTGYTLRARTAVFAYRLAPVQINYLGYPGTMGAPFYDYVIADKTVIPEAEQRHFTESVIYLPHAYQANDNTRAIGEHTPSRMEVGLPEEGFVFCCFNNTYKGDAPKLEFDIWMRLLRQVEGSVLWLFKANEWAGENLKRQAQKRGVAPERIVFAAPVALADHLARASVWRTSSLDTFNHNAHTTASDALCWPGCLWS